MRVIFTGDPTELEAGEGLSRVSTTQFGKVFPMSAEVDVSDLPEAQQRKLLNNPHFRVAGVEAPPVNLILPAGVSAPAAEADASAVVAPARQARAKSKSEA